jgi:hypothetical protein
VIFLKYFFPLTQNRTNPDLPAWKKDLSIKKIDLTSSLSNSPAKRLSRGSSRRPGSGAMTALIPVRKKREEGTGEKGREQGGKRVEEGRRGWKRNRTRSNIKQNILDQDLLLRLHDEGKNIIAGNNSEKFSEFLENNLGYDINFAHPEDGNTCVHHFIPPLPPSPLPHPLMPSTSSIPSPPHRTSSPSPGSSTGVWRTKPKASP